MKKKVNIKRVFTVIFLTALVLVLSAFYTLPLRGLKDISEEEQRTLQQVPSFTAASFLSGTYQKELEDSIGDQLYLSAEIKYIVKQVQNMFTDRTSALFKSFQTAKNISLPAQKENNLVYPPVNDSATDKFEPAAQEPSYIYTEVVAGKVYKLDDSGYLIQKAVSPSQFIYELYDPAMLERVTFPKYLYFISTSQSIDFSDREKYHPFEYIKTKFHMTGYAQLSFHSFEEYKRYFYQTDHHWNYRGSYLGYTQIMKMMEGVSVKLQIPTGEHTYNTIYNGSLARDNLLRCSTEQFTVYTFDLPPYQTYVDDVEQPYGFRSLYVSDTDFPHNTYSNHYGMYYGDDHAKVVYKFNNPNAESILILATSYSNAINELIASHYNETHVLDFRHYRKKYGEGIDAQKYMEQNHLSKLLIIGDISSLGYQKKD